MHLFTAIASAVCVIVISGLMRFVNPDSFPFGFHYDNTLAGRFDQGLRINTLDNIVFTDGDCPSSNKKYLPLITPADAVVELSGCRYPVTYKAVGYIYYFNGDKAYHIVRPVPEKAVSSEI